MLMFSPSLAILLFTNSPTVPLWSLAEFLLVERFVRFEIGALGFGYIFDA